MRSPFGKSDPVLYITNEDKKKSTDNSENIADFVIKVEYQIYRQRQDFATYKTAVQYAENYLNPQRYPLYQIYINAVLDSHLTACMQQRKNLTLGKKFCVLNKDETENEEKTKLLQRKWFYDFVSLSLDSRFWGHSLIIFDDYLRKEKEFKGVQLVPRQYVKPEIHNVVAHWGDPTGVDYTEDPWRNWNIGVGDPCDLGLLLKAAPLVMWKTGAMGSWAEYQEVFGSPLRIGTTNSRDAKTQNSFIDRLKNMGAASWFLLGPNEKLELKESQKQDAYKVYDEMVNRINSELSKLILGQTGTMDEKAHVGSAEVHERVLMQVAEEDEKFIENVFACQLTPFLIEHGMLNDGDVISCDDSEELTYDQILAGDNMLLQYYDIDPEQIKETYGRDVTPKAKDPGLTGFQTRMNNLYP